MSSPPIFIPWASTVSWETYGNEPRGTNSAAKRKSWQGQRGIAGHLLTKAFWLRCGLCQSVDYSRLLVIYKYNKQACSLSHRKQHSFTINYLLNTKHFTRVMLAHVQFGCDVLLLRETVVFIVTLTAVLIFRRVYKHFPACKLLLIIT